MDEYKINFDIDTKIAWNRMRLKELLEMYKKIESYYPLFLGYLGFIGVYFFDFILTLLDKFDYFFFLLTLATGISLLVSIFYMAKIILTQEWNLDSTPYKVYKTTFDEMTIYLRSQSGSNSVDANVLDFMVRESYLSLLEENLEENLNIYKEKKKYVSHSLKVIIVSFIIYSVNITYYKHLCKMQENTNKPKVEKEKVHEGQQKNVNKQHIIKEGIKPKKS